MNKPPNTGRKAAGAERDAKLTQQNVGRDTSATPSRSNGVSKSTFLQQHGTRNQHQAPASLLSSVPVNDLKKKVDAPNAGDHSPSIPTVNTTTDRTVGITGRSSHKGNYGRNIAEDKVPTLQFTTSQFQKDSGERDTAAGSAAHTRFTSLREAGGVGEKHKKRNFNDVLDDTQKSYSSYDGKGEPVDSAGKRLRSSTGSQLTPLDSTRVNVHAESNKGPNLHDTARGVQPMVAQAMINMNYRDPGFMQRIQAHQKERMSQVTNVAKDGAVRKKSKLDDSQSSSSALTAGQAGVQGVQNAIKTMPNKK